MTRTFMLPLILLVTSATGFCQESGTTLAFEVASVTPCKPGTPEPPGEHMGMVQFTMPGGRFKANATTLQFLLEWAYGIQPAQHSAGPAWIGNDRYDVVAKAPGNATDDEMKLMVQTLLSERFHLKVHRESRKMVVYVISPGKAAPKLELAKEGDVHGIKITPQKDTEQKVVSWHVAATRYTLSQLTDSISRPMGRPFINRTGMNGEYNFTLDLAPDESTPNPLDPTLLMDAMRKQLGLTLKTEDTPVDYLVIDSAEKVAAGN